MQTDVEAGVVKAIHLKGDNSDLIVSAARLGYILYDDVVLDATYGKGVFWKKMRPQYLVVNDWDPDINGVFHYDFREFPTDWEAKHDVVVFDPDYKLQGTSSNNGPASSNARYGMDRAYRPVNDTWELYTDGMRECHRVLKPGGFLFVKTMDQVVSGAKKWLTFDIVGFARRGTTLGGLRMEFVDLFMLEGMRAQPSNRTRKCSRCEGDGFVENPNYDIDLDPAASTECYVCEGTGKIRSVQQHSATNYSTLLIFKKGRS